jgi:SNF2 family DNA or RNA helicase
LCFRCTFQAADHPALLHPSVDESPTSQARKRAYLKALCDTQPSSALTHDLEQALIQADPSSSLGSHLSHLHSGKVAALRRIMHRHVQQGQDRVLVFAHSTKLLNILESWCSLNGYITLRLDGNVSPKIRSERIKQFQSDRSVSVFLISIRAGGEGLNLTGANVVVLFEPGWNPSLDSQAQV